MQEVKAIDLKVGDLLKTAMGFDITITEIFDDYIKIRREDIRRSYIVPIHRIESDLSSGRLHLISSNKTTKQNDTTIPTTNDCKHTDKFKNSAYYQYFWQCKSCKADLGNV